MRGKEKKMQVKRDVEINEIHSGGPTSQQSGFFLSLSSNHPFVYF